ncbi:MAG TPA: hypothetical protein PLJ84_03010 [Bacteroidales bacterium]|nr:hypothetical protein [Bacteroidales bacterium]HPT01539.1 hypothetical protein [Bacteroidales bacterium]
MKPFSYLLPAILAAGMILLITSCDDTGNKAPSISSVRINPDSVNAGGTVKVTVNAVDPEQDPITYLYEVSGGSITPDGSYGYWSLPSAPGTATVEVTATDSEGNSSSPTTISVTVLAPVTQITGYAKLDAGYTGNLEGSVVHLETYGAGLIIKTITATGSGSGIVFNLAGIDPGTYQLIIWKDTDHSGNPNSGDYVGWYGSGGPLSPDFDPIEITGGQNFICNISMTHPAK